MADPKTCLHNIITSGYDAPFIYCASCGTDEPAIEGKLYTYDRPTHTWVCVPNRRVVNVPDPELKPIKIAEYPKDCEHRILRSGYGPSIDISCHECKVDLSKSLSLSGRFYRYNVGQDLWFQDKSGNPTGTLVEFSESEWGLVATIVTRGGMERS